jgi:hypothetical protein
MANECSGGPMLVADDIAAQLQQSVQIALVGEAGSG